MRLEQYYPLPAAQLQEVLQRYPNADVTWVQDEPANQGVWPFLAVNLAAGALGGRGMRCVSRPAAASPSAGNMRLHKDQNAKLISQAFDF